MSCATRDAQLGRLDGQVHELVEVLSEGLEGGDFAADGVYRFALQSEGGSPGGNLTLDRSSSTEGVLTGARSVVVSAPSFPQGSWAIGNGVVLLDANDFSGTLSIHPGAFVRGYAQTAVGASPFGHADGTMYIAGARLELYGASGGKPASKGALSIRGHANVYLHGINAAYQTDLSFASLSRLERATLGLTAILNTLGTKETVAIQSGAPSNDAQGMVAPWMVMDNGSSFLTYGGSGFAPKAFTSTDLSTAGPPDIVNIGDGAVSGAKTVHALRTTGTLSSAGSGDVLTITSGGLLLVSSTTRDHTANIAFGSAEGVIFSNSGGQRFNGTITGSNGLTLGAPLKGNPASSFFFNPPSAGGLSGTLTINQGQAFLSGNAMADLSGIVINGARNMGDGNSQTAALGPWGSGNQTVPNSLTITVGLEGGALFNSWNSGLSGNLLVDAKITGGTLLVGSGHSGKTISINSSLNDYSGGTCVIGGPVFVGASGKLGTGDVIIGGSRGNLLSRLIVQGTDNIPDSARIIFAGITSVDTDALVIQSASETIGSLEGCGMVFFSRSGGSVLTMGGNNESTDFYGTFSDYALAPSYTGRTGTVVKAGAGTFTLWGEGLHLGGTRVEAGTLLVHGALEKSVRVESSGTLGGTGLIAERVTVDGGTLDPGASAGILTVAGLTMQNNAVFSAELNGTQAGAEYDRLVVTDGDVVLGSTTALSISLGYQPSVGDSFMILENTTDTFISGTFVGGNEASASFGGVNYLFSVDYAGGSGNDIVLQVLPTGTLILVR